VNAATNRVSALLKENNIDVKSTDFSTVNDGASGAVVLECDGKFIIKYAHSSEMGEAKMNHCRNEYNFYSRFVGQLDFIPQIIFQTSTNEELLLVLKKYEAILPERWDEILQNSGGAA